MDCSELEFLKGYADTEDFPLVICDMNCKIRFMNSFAVNKYQKYGGIAMKGRSLFAYLNEEAKSKVDMAIEWFKESPEHNKLLAVCNTCERMDIYMCAIRDSDRNLIGFCSKHLSRKQDDNTPYETKD